MSADLGQDCSTFVGGTYDLDPLFGTITGARLVAEAVARRLLTPRGSLRGSPNYGFDVAAMLNEGFTPGAVFALRHAIEAEAEADERVLSADVQTSLSGSTLSVTVRGLTADGPFALTLAVSDLTVALLTISPQ